MPKQPRVIWTEENNQRLMDMASSGASVFKAAAVFNCKIDTVRNQARKLRTPFVSINEYRKRIFKTDPSPAKRPGASGF